MHILQVTSATRLKYGAMAAMRLLGDQLEEQGHRVTYCAFKGRGGATELRDQGKTLIEVPVRLKIDPIGAWLLAREIKKLKVDVVHTHLSTSSLVGCLAAKWAKIPSVATVHGLSGKNSFAFADHLIAVSQAVKDHLIGQGVDGSRITVVRNGMPIFLASDQDRADAKSQFNLQDVLVFGTLGRVAPLKGVYEAILALGKVQSQLPPWKLLVLGEGEDLNRCTELARSLGIEDNVTFAGFVSPVRPYVCALDLLIFPTFKEAMPLALIEAGMCRVPTVAFATGGVPEVLTPQTGITVPTGDVDQLSGAILSLATDPARRAEMGLSAQARALEHFSVERMVSETVAVYNQMLDRPTK